MMRVGANCIPGDQHSPSPLYSGETRAELAAARERAGVRGLARAAPVVVPCASRTRPLTLTLSPEYRGEGIRGANRLVELSRRSDAVAALIRLVCMAALLAPTVCLLGGCTSAVESGHNTALDSVNLVQMTDQMAASIAADPRVQEAIRKNGPLKVVVQPAENHMTAEVLPPGQAEAFVTRVRSLLSQHAPDQYVWVMNRDTFYRLRGREREDVLGPAPDAVNPQYALWAQFYSLTDENSKRRSSAYLCAFELTDLERRITLWRDSYQVKKAANKAFLD
jgi:hypothetical protein